MGLFGVNTGPKLSERSSYKLKLPPNHGIKRVSDDTFEIEEEEQAGTAINE
jgi:hypothetical protein